jgi:4'-phosphopantetheinyl transferase
VKSVDIWQFDIEPKQKSEPFLRQVLARYISENDLIIERGEFGKPFLRDFQEVHFNVSHSGEKLLIAISNTPVGIDIEQIKPRKSLVSLVKKCFAQSEQNYWFDLPENEKLAIFYDFWTRKEAVVKGIGRGIALGLNCCEIDVNQPNAFLNLPISENWHTQSLKISPDYCAAIATSNANATLKFCSL